MTSYYKMTEKQQTELHKQADALVRDHVRSGLSSDEGNSLWFTALGHAETPHPCGVDGLEIANADTYSHEEHSYYNFSAAEAEAKQERAEEAQDAVQASIDRLEAKRDLLEPATTAYDALSYLIELREGLRNTLEEIAEQDNWEVESAEPLCWFIVDSWLSWQLEQCGELIITTPYYKVWGRTTYGQQISADGVMIEIAQDYTGVIR